MNTTVSARIGAHALQVLESFAAANSLTKTDALKALILAQQQVDEAERKMLRRLAKIEENLIAKIDSLEQPQATQTETNFDQSQAFDEVKKLQKAFGLMLDHFVLPNAGSDHKPGINQARKLLSE
jgi:GTPase Era involved in 16S rRNA processing